jgi:hypothetical protein
VVVVQETLFLVVHLELAGLAVEVLEQLLQQTEVLA